MTILHSIDGQNLEPWLLERGLMLSDFLTAATEALLHGEVQQGAIKSDNGVLLPHDLTPSNRSVVLKTGNILLCTDATKLDGRLFVSSYAGLVGDVYIQKVINCEIVAKGIALAIEATTVPTQSWLRKL